MLITRSPRPLSAQPSVQFGMPFGLGKGKGYQKVGEGQDTPDDLATRRDMSIAEADTVTLDRSRKIAADNAKKNQEIRN